MPQHRNSRRIVTGEIMDAPTLDTAAHLQALAGLERINRISRTARQIFRPLRTWIPAARLQRLALLDVACGGGDVSCAVASGIQQLGLPVDLILLDRSPVALGQATVRAARDGISSQAIAADVLAEFPFPSADVVMSSLFLHHLRQPEQVITLLRKMKASARHLIVISDLRRSRWGHAVVWMGTRALSRSRIVHYDGVASSRAAWTPAELRTLAAAAGLTGVQILGCWPWRMQLVWQRSEGDGVREDS